MVGLLMEVWGGVWDRVVKGESGAGERFGLMADLSYLNGIGFVLEEHCSLIFGVVGWI